MSFANASCLAFHNNTFNDVQGNLYNNSLSDQPGEQGFRELSSKVYPRTAYNTHSHLPVAPHCQTTRDLVLTEVFDWIDSETANICWLYGAPNTGKSTIAQATAEQCSERGTKLGASFYTQRSHPHSASTHLIPSIAYQLGVSLPEMRIAIGEAVERDVAILHKPLEDQIQELIVKPFSAASPSNDYDGSRTPGKSILIIIDGLDQCFDSYYQLYIPRFLHAIASTKNIPTRWLITSQRTYQIRRSFDAISSYVHSISLSTIDRRVEVEHGISTYVYLRHRLNEIYEDYPTVMGILVRAVQGGIPLRSTVCLDWYQPHTLRHSIPGGLLCETS